MIVRAVLQHPELLEKFDFFNDAKNTLVWLKMLGTPEALERAKQLQEKYDHYIANWRK